MKKIFAICIFSLCCCALYSAGFVFADKGKAAYTIVLPDKTAGFEQQAAKDLQTFFGKMSGASFEIVPESRYAGKKGIFIGNTAFARKNGVEVKKLSAETWVIKNAGKNLILSGGEPVGAFYAVWELLHKFDCYPLTMASTSTPLHKTLACDITDIQKKPAFDGREIGDGVSRRFVIMKADAAQEAYLLWKLRSGQNGNKSKAEPLWKYSGHHVTTRPSSHSLSSYVNPKLFDTHPEYFAMNEAGKRYKPLKFAYSGCVCMSNMDVKKHTLNSLRKMIQTDRKTLPKEKWPIIYDISTLDNTPKMCLCPECEKITKYEGSQTGLLLHYINYIATEIRKEYPEIIIRTFGYSASSTPPVKILPADNVLIFLTDKFTESDPYRPLTHPINAGRLDYFAKWRKSTKRIMVWDYWNLGGYLKPPQPCTVVNAIAPDFKFFRDMRVTDVFVETGRCWHVSQSFIDLSYFLGSQLLMDPDQDAERLINIYFSHYFGPAAKEMRKIFDHIRTGTMKHKGRQTSNVVGHWEYMTPEFLFNSYSTMKKLSAKLKEPYKQRVDDELGSFVWYALAKRDSYRAIFKKNGIDLDKKLPAECRKLVKKHIARFGGKDFKRINEEFEKDFKSINLNLRRPEKFKDVADENFRMIAYPHFSSKRRSNSYVVDDPESIQGKALKSAHTDESRHGVNKKYGTGRTTFFRWGNHGVPGGVQVTLKKVAQDEKYHWYRIPGKLELKGTSYFWGHFWAVQAATGHLYKLTDGNPLDNTWDEVWFSAKFTGPAYVPGSTKENAIYIDMAVLVKNDKQVK